METQFGSNKGVEVFVAHGYRDILCRCVEWDFPTTHSILEELTELLFDRVSNCLHSSSELIDGMYLAIDNPFNIALYCPNLWHLHGSTMPRIRPTPVRLSPDALNARINQETILLACDVK